jgi:hypothetical protein
MRRLRRAIADPHSPGSLSARARARRWAALGERFPDLAEMRVVDLGGVVRGWELSPLRPLEVVTINLFPQEATAAWMRTVVGDACDPPESLRRERFDLVYSNSVIEHVGGHWRREAFAEATHALADHHWVQTPYRYFPLEPHWLFPLFQFLPLRGRAEVTRHWPLGRHAPILSDAISTSMTVELLSETDMRHYFPESEIVRELTLRLPKSLIAVK